MRCPFLREAQVKFCRASAFRKMIVRNPGQLESERCSSPDYVHCPAAKKHHEEQPSLNHCPFLQESLVQYCSAASVTKYIPYSEAALSQCGTESHKFCDAFITLANPDGGGVGDGACTTMSGEENSTLDTAIERIRVPEQLFYSPNHMWLAVGDDGVLHVGIDAFLAKVLGEIDRLTFVTVKGMNRPSVVFTVRGVDLQVLFPNPILIRRVNGYLRTNPSKIITDPYTHGWLFEGEADNHSAKKPPSAQAGLIAGSDAQEWMKNEVNALTQHVHSMSTLLEGHELMADGGTCADGVMTHLHREEVLDVFNAFFSPYNTWRKKT